jgi:hypothetical protein
MINSIEGGEIAFRVLDEFISGGFDFELFLIFSLPFFGLPLFVSFVGLGIFPSSK